MKDLLDLEPSPMEHDIRFMMSDDLSCITSTERESIPDLMFCVICYLLFSIFKYDCSASSIRKSTFRDTRDCIPNYYCSSMLSGI